MSNPVNIRTDAALRYFRHSSGVVRIAAPLLLATIACTFFALGTSSTALAATTCEPIKPNCEFGSAGEGPGQIGHAQAIAVDNAADKMVDESAGDVYIGDAANRRVD